MQMKKMFCRAVVAALCSTAALSVAADFDGSKALICATLEAHDCDAGDTCQRGLPETVGAPQFLRIDFAKKQILGPQRSTPIRLFDGGKEQVLIQGTEMGFGWTMALDSTSGKLNATLVNRDGVFVVFGTCTPL